MKKYSAFMAGILSLMLVFGLVLTACDNSGGDDGGGGGGDAVITLAAIAGVTVPATGGTPVAAIDSAQYSGTVTWSPAAGAFAAETSYTATITLIAKPGYTLTGVTANFFTVAGATSAINGADSGVVTAVFPATVAAAPAAPVAPVVTLEGDDSQIIVSWTAVTGAVSYQVVWSRGVTVPPDTLTNSNSKDGITGTNYVISGLTNGSPYNVWVRGKKNDNTYTDYSEMKTATPVISDAAPAKPIVTATPTDDGEIEISWEATKGATEYDVMVGLSATGVSALKVAGNVKSPNPFKVTTGSGGVSSVTRAGAGPTYYVFVLARNENPNPDLETLSDSKQVTVIDPPANAAEFENTTWTSAGGPKYEFKPNGVVVYTGNTPAETDQGTYTYNKPSLSFTLATGGQVGPITVKGKTFKSGVITYIRQ